MNIRQLSTSSRAKFLTASFFFLLSVCQNGSAQTVLVNEFMASNSSVLADNAGDFEDWVELHNPGATDIDLGDWYLSDNAANLSLWRIPDNDPATTTIPAGGYLLLWFDNEPLEGPLHCSPKLSADGEAIILTRPDGTSIVDQRSYGPQIQNVSEGRKPNGGSGWDFYAQPTPLAANSTAPGAPKVAPVVASVPGGKYNGSATVSLSCATPGAVIRYTTDGSVPTASSTAYSASLVFSATTPLRAVAFAPLLLPSPILTHTYFLDLNHSFPVVSLVFEEKDFFDPATGIIPNFLEDITTTTNIEFFETNSQTAAFNQYVETEIQGTASATQPQKSLDIKPKASLGGSSTINYPIFPDLPYTQYKRFVLRNAGQDWNVMMFRDEFVTSLVSQLNDLPVTLRRPELHTQAYRPSVVYYNGKYWGIHNIRERMNRFYVEQHFGLADGQHDMIENFSEALSGDSIEWFNFVSFLQNNSFQDNARFDQLKQQIDYQNFLDYCAFYVYVDNQDWPGNNVRRFRERTPGAKWRWISYDFDYTFGLFTPGSWNTGDASPDALGRLLNPFSQVWPNPDWATLLFRKCWENPAFRTDFVNRMADFMNTIFTPQRLNARLDFFKNQYQPEIEQHFIRWTTGYYEPYWLDNIQKTRNFSNNRPALVRQHVNANLAEVNGSANLTLTASPTNGGSIQVSTITLGQANFPWTGNYFTGVKIPLKAVPNPGFVFVGWSDPALGQAAEVTVTLGIAKTLTANFQPAGGPVNYCQPGSSFPWLEFIKKVQIGAFVRESSKETYTNVPGVAATLTPGVATPIALTTGYSFQTFDEYWRVWIDYNRDGQFSSTEVAFQGIVTAPLPAANVFKAISGNVVVPLGTAFGETRLRIGMKRGSYPTPCEVVNFGEFEDYTINIGVGGGMPCSLTAAVSNVVCNNNGTASVPDDDRFSFVLEVLGTGANAGWVANIGGQNFAGTYGTPRTLSFFNISAGALNFTVFDSGNPGCSTQVSVTPPPPCSTAPPPCAINASVSGIACNNNATATDPTDDKFNFSLTVSGTGASTSWVADVQNTSQTGSYGAAKTLGPYLIADGDIGFTVRDIATPGCTTQVNVVAPAPCSNQPTGCSMVASARNATCDNNDTPASASDDKWYFEMTVTGTGLGPNFVATVNGIVFNGLYGVTKTVGVFLISDGDVTVSLRDAANPSCTTSLTVSPPSTCSGGGSLPLNCSSRSNYPWHDWISGVSVGTMSKVSSKNTFSNFIGTTVEGTRGESLPVSLEASFSFETFEEYWRIWVDWNHDGALDPSTEMAFEGIAPRPASGFSSVLDGAFEVPTNATPGAARMRVSMKRGGYPDPCEVFENGEVEDYAFVVSQNLAAGQTSRFGTLPNEALLENLTIFPNPANDVAIVNLKKFVGKPVNIKLIDALGVVKISWETEELRETYFQFDLTAQASGTYFVWVNSPDQKLSGKALVISKN